MTHPPTAHRASEGVEEEAEAAARRADPHVWALEPPDVSSAFARANSLIRAKVRMGLLWWNPVSERYEPTALALTPTAAEPGREGGST